MERVFDLLVAGAKQGPEVRYGFAAALIALTTLAHFGLEPLLPGYTFILFYPSLFVVAVLFGRGPGLLAIGSFASVAIFFSFEPQFSLRVNDPRNVLALVIFALSGLIAVAITEALHQALIRIAAAEQEKDLLLREFHHRIRNDLQGVASILHMARRSGADGAAVIDRAVARIGVLGNVYARLRPQRGVVKVNAQEFITGLAEELRTAAGMRPISIHASAEEAVLGIGCAVAVGIIVNELVTNALKYAFPEDRPGSITVDFSREQSEFVLSVSDDGVGLTPSENTEAGPKGTGLGGPLTRQLALQLKGRLETTSDHGVKAVLRFPVAAAAT